ncbi:MAG: hypothetical protein AAFV93_09400 [Chloroflexota bacterium]
MMNEITIARTNVNFDRLDEDLSQIAGYEGASLNSGGVVIYLEDGTDPTPFRDAVIAHRESDTSARQTEKDALRSEIATLKQRVGDIDSLTALLQLDAIKLVYKTLELNDLL